MSERAFDLDVAAQKPRDFAADGQAQTGSAVTSAGGSVGLLKGFENQFLLGRCDADSGIGNRKRNNAILARAAAFVQLNVEADAAFFGELQRVGKQVFQDLLQTPEIRTHRRRRAGMQRDRKVQAFLRGNRLKRAHQLVAHIQQRDVGNIDFHFAGFDFGQV